MMILSHTTAAPLLCLLNLGQPVPYSTHAPAVPVILECRPAPRCPYISPEKHTLTDMALTEPTAYFLSGCSSN